MLTAFYLTSNGHKLLVYLAYQQFRCIFRYYYGYVKCILVVTCWERADIFALLCVMFSCVFVTFYVVSLIVLIPDLSWERSGSVVECLTREGRVAGSSLTGVTALWSLSKTHLS